MTDTTISSAIVLARQLGEIASVKLADSKMTKGVHKALAEADAKTCSDAAAMLQKLGTEVDRLRQGIGCHFYGRISGPDLIKMTYGWNGDASRAGEKA